MSGNVELPRASETACWVVNKGTIAYHVSRIAQDVSVVIVVAIWVVTVAGVPVAVVIVVIIIVIIVVVIVVIIIVVIVIVPVVIGTNQVLKLRRDDQLDQIGMVHN
ncbi:MAG: hypothetical protein ABSG33_10685 [Candidatus Bathyarchaeia archaeon]